MCVLVGVGVGARALAFVFLVQDIVVVVSLWSCPCIIYWQSSGMRRIILCSIDLVEWKTNSFCPLSSWTVQWIRQNGIRLSFTITAAAAGSIPEVC